MNADLNGNLFARIRSCIGSYDAPFIHNADGTVITYNDMLKRSAQFANALVDLGVKPGDRVAVQVEKSIDAVFLYLGCVRAGGVFLPLNTDYRDKELAYFINDAKPTVFVCKPDRKSSLIDIAKENSVSFLETLDDRAQPEAGSLAQKADAAETGFEDIKCNSEDLVAILYTSGTTGRSKGAMLTHANLASNAETLVDYWQFSRQDILLHALPIFHTHGLFVAINTVLMSGASMIFHSKFNPQNILADLPDATAMMGVPTFYSRLLSTPELTRNLVGHMRLFVSGSAPLSPEVHKDFTKRTGHVILERYGMTETNMNTSNPYDGERKPGTVGLPLPGVEIRISAQVTGETLPSEEIGMIEVRGPNVFKGYWEMPEKTAQEFRKDGFFITGDLGKISKDGYVSIVGRDKDLIISGGFNVYPAEVENAIDAIQGIAEVAVIGVPHADFGEGVTAVVVASKAGQPCADCIRQHLSKELAKYKIPKEVFFIDALPRNKMGKIQKNELREKYHKTYIQ